MAADEARAAEHGDAPFVQEVRPRGSPGRPGDGRAFCR
jgi:hypothetical protein